MVHKKEEGTYHHIGTLMKEMPGFLSPRRGLPLLLIPEYSGISKEQRIPDRSITAHRKPPVKCFLTTFHVSSFLIKLKKKKIKQRKRLKNAYFRWSYQGRYLHFSWELDEMTEWLLRLFWAGHTEPTKVAVSLLCLWNSPVASVTKQKVWGKEHKDMGVNPNSYNQVVTEIFSMYLISRKHRFLVLNKVFSHK